MKAASLVLAALCAAGLARAETVARIDSPSKVLTVALELEDGRLAYRVERFGQPVVEPSRLGFLLHGAPRLERNLSVESIATGAHDEVWEQAWGERRFSRNHYNELIARIAETLAPHRRFEVVFRVYDDGVGFRYAFPEQDGARTLRIAEELTEFAIAGEATAWWIPAGEWNRYEYLYDETPLSELSQAHTPLTLRTRDGLHIALHEAALVDYAGMWLRRTEGQRLRAQLAPGSQAWKVERALPFATPWRTLVIADSAGGLYESDLILNLNEPNRLGDVGWFEPAKYVGVWWELHLENTSWATGEKHGATTANTRRYIDFAAEHGFRGVLVEGWNPGWDGDWFGNGWDFDFTRPTPDFDLEGLAAYAREKGVHLIGHHETGCAVSHYERQLDKAFALYQRLGIDVVKTGYVCDAGGIERRDRRGGEVLREWHDGQWMARHHLEVVTEAAKHRIAINAHEPVKDTGLRRTYPNQVSREGARGMEYAAWGEPPNPPSHEPTLLFTRMLSGPMDYTPGIVSLKGRGGRAIPSTLARQLALYVVLYSPVQMVADLPEHYAAQPEAFEFIKHVPADWAQTRVAAGEIGDYAVIVRRDRNSEDWYLGAVTDEHGRLLQVPLGFLDPGRPYRAEIYRDGEGAHYERAPFEFVRETREVHSGQTLTLRLAAGGGAAMRFVPAPRPVSPPAPMALPQAATGRIERLADFPSQHVTPRNVDIWLPEDYPADAPYAVVYAHDGQMLFDATHTWNRKEWRMDEVAGALIAQRRTRPFIVVGIWNAGSDRGAEYFPQQPYEALSPAQQRDLWLPPMPGWGVPLSRPAYSDAYLRFLVEELKPQIDRHYAVSLAPQDTVALGSSMGGLVSWYALTEHPQVFGGVAALSTHWPGGHLADADAAPRAFLDHLQRKLPEPGSHRLYFDLGTATLDAAYPPLQQRADAVIAAKGYGERDWRTRVFEGAPHDEDAWSARLHEPLEFLLPPKPE